MKIGLVFDLKTDYGISADDLDFCDFSYLSEIESVQKNLMKAGHDVYLIKFTKENPEKTISEMKTVDIVFNMAEGFNSRNREGWVPSLCETYSIPYIGTDSFGVSFTLHKYQSKLFAEALGIKIPKGILFDYSIHKIDDLESLITNKNLQYPFVIKPNCEGSSMGVKFVADNKSLLPEIISLYNLYNEEVMVEEYIDGAEISAEIIGTGNDAKVLSILHYVENSGENIKIFDSRRKRTENHKIIEPTLPKYVLSLIEKWSLILHKAFRFYDYSRIDWKVSGTTPFLLELTPLPQLDDSSEFGVGAKINNLTFSQALDMIVQSAIKRYRLDEYTDRVDFHNWKWQLNNALCNYDEILKCISLSNEEKKAFKSPRGTPVKISPFVLKHIDKDNPDCPIRKQFVPAERKINPIKNLYFEQDFLQENEAMVASGLIRRYPDRVALIATYDCAAYCRHCTRSRGIGLVKDFDQHKEAIEYIKNNPDIKDVLITGGDPLILSDDEIQRLINQLRKISHVEIMRIGTRTPVTLPMRITENLIRILKTADPLYVNIHVNHVKELTDETVHAINLLTSAGIPVGSQTVLLRDINDDENILKELFSTLIKIKVKPYYLYQCDRVIGCEQFYVNPLKGLDLINSLQGKISGLAIPKYILDMPGSMGKVPIGPCGLIAKDNESLTVQNYQKQQAIYEI